MPSRGHRLALGATAVVTVGLASAFASAIGAQTTSDPIRSEIVSVDDAGTPQDLPDTVVPAISDTGGAVVYETVVSEPGIDPAGSGAPEGRRVWVRDRIEGTSRAVAEAGSVAPGISGDGCIVAYTVLTAVDATLTTVDRCTTTTEFPLPIGTVLDIVALEAANVASPSLSFDGSTIVWSTGREIRRYTRPVEGGPHVRSHSFDVVAGGSPDVVTGPQTDVSADGRTVVFVAGTGTSPFEPTPANVYVWTLTTPQLDPELISVTSTGDPAPADSTSPTISADGSFVVFGSTSPDLAVVGESSVVAPFVVGVDRVTRTAQVLVDDAERPTVSADAKHVVYLRGDAIRVLSSDATSTIDLGIDELADAGPTGAVAISQYGRWLVFAGPTDTFDAPGDESVASVDSADAAAAVWAVDRASSNSEVVDTTTTTTTVAPTQPTTPTTVVTTTVPSTSTTEPSATVPEVESLPTVPATTLLPTVIVPRFPTATDRFPSVGLPPAPRRVVGRTSSGSSFDSSFGSAADPGLTAAASPVSFEPTVIGAGRRVAPVIVTNSGSLVRQVASASIDVPGPFTVVTDGCSGSSVGPGSSCAVDVQFAPITVGQASATLTFRLTDGSLVTAALDGEGVPEPTLDLVPAVAGAGQTVTVFGVGFPAGSIVELSRPGSPTAESIVVDADGAFAHVVVVLPNTPVGSAALSVSGQPDAFSDVAAELLVSSRGSASADAALRAGPGGLRSR